MDSFLAVGEMQADLVEVPTPDDITWGLQDISSSDAGRVQDAANTMYKMRSSQKRKLQLTWKNPDAATTAAVLQAFNPEYFFVRYYDPMDGAFETREFYAGDRSAPFRSFKMNTLGAVFSTVSFDIVER